MEDGVRQEIQALPLQTLTPDATVSPGPVVRRTPQTIDLSPRNRRVFLIYLGRGDVRGPSEGIDGIVHLVRDLLLPQEPVAILAWNRATDFTTDRASTLALLDRFKHGYRKVEKKLDDYFHTPAYLYGNRQIPDWLQKDIDAVFLGADKAPMRSVNPQARALSPQTEQRVRDTYDSFNAPASDPLGRLLADTTTVDLPTFLADTAQTAQDEGNLYAGIEYMRHLEGEKHLVWLTEYGLRRGFLDAVELDRDLARVAADGRVVLNIIRAGGTEISHGGPGAAESRIPSRVTGIAATSLLLPAAASRTFADLTGGRSDANRFRNASISADYIDQASRSQYLLGYYPINARLDGRFRNVTVTVNRPGLTVLVRRGYYARGEAGGLDRQSVVTYGRIAAAAGDVREIPDLSLHATAVDAPPGRGVEIKFTIEVGRLTFKQANGLNVATLEVAVFCLDKKQHAVGDMHKAIELTYTDDPLAQVRGTGVTLSLTVPVKAVPDSLKLCRLPLP